RFITVTGDDAKARGRRAAAILWNVSRASDSPDSHGESQVGEQGCESGESSPVGTHPTPDSDSEATATTESGADADGLEQWLAKQDRTLEEWHDLGAEKAT